MKKIIAVLALFTAIVTLSGASLVPYFVNNDQLPRNISVTNVTASEHLLSKYGGVTDTLHVGDNGTTCLGCHTPGTGINYVALDSVGVTLYGTARRWNDFNMEASNLRTGTSTPSYTTVGPDANKLYGLVFIGSGVATDEVYCSTEMLHQWAEGTTAHVHLHYSPTTTAGGNVQWYVYWFWQDVSGAITDRGEAQPIFPVSTTAWAHELSDIVEIPGTGHHIGSYLHLRISRNPGQTGDTAGNIWLRAVGIHTLMDSFGSREEAAK